MASFIERLKSMVGAAGVLTTIVPGLTYFQGLTPPDFGSLWVLTSAMALFFLYLGFKLRTPKGRVLPRATIFIIASLTCVALYVPAFRGTTVSNCIVRTSEDGAKSDECERLQVGPGLLTAGLTPKAISILSGNDEIRTPYKLLGQLGISSDNVPVLWNQSGVILCSIALILLYNASVILWVLAWGTFMKVQGIDGN